MLYFTYKKQSINYYGFANLLRVDVSDSQSEYTKRSCKLAKIVGQGIYAEIKKKKMYFFIHLQYVAIYYSNPDKLQNSFWERSNL